MSGAMDKDELDAIDQLAGEAIERIGFFEVMQQEGAGMEPDRLAVIMLHAVMNAVGSTLQYAPEGEEREALCREAQADLDSIIETLLMPESEFAARRRRSMIKLVPPRDKP